MQEERQLWRRPEARGRKRDTSLRIRKKREIKVGNNVDGKYRKRRRKVKKK